MELSIVAALFYIITTAALITGFMLLKKSDKRLMLGTWLPVSFIALMGWQTFSSGIINLAHIKVNIISLGIINFAAALFLLYISFKNKKVQGYSLNMVDIIAWILIILVVSFVAYRRFGEFLSPTYSAWDAAVHMSSARGVINSGHIGGMYYAALHNGLLMETFGAFTKLSHIYKIYVLGDVFHLILAGFMFWGVIRRYTDGFFLKVFGVLATYMYVMGYPFNSTLFGFSYLGMGVTVIAFIIAVMDIYMEGEIDKKINIFLLALGCYGIFQSYVLFMPVVFFAVFICVLIRQKRDGKLFSPETIGVELGIFLLATLLGLWYTYGGIFMSRGESGGGTTVSSAINIEGGIYADLYSNFIFLIPLALYGLYMLLKEKKNIFIAVLTILDVIFVAALLYMALNHKVSAYYYYKNYYMLWLLAWVLAFSGIAHIKKETRLIPVFTMGLWCLIIFMGRFDIEDRISNRNPLLVPQLNEENLSHIYKFNYVFLRMSEHIPKDKLDIYEYVCEELLSKEDKYIPVAGSIEDYFWMQAITNQDCSDFQYWNYGDKEREGETFFDTLHTEDIHYLIVFTDSEFYLKNQTYFDNMERLYENKTGYIALVR